MSSDNSDLTNNPSMLHGHAAYVAGAAKETLGSFASDDMKNAGASDKQAAVDEMRAAKAQNEAQGDTEVMKNEALGKVEQTLGSAAGCEGMVEEGGKRQD